MAESTSHLLRQRSEPLGPSDIGGKYDRALDNLSGDTKVMTKILPFVAKKWAEQNLLEYEVSQLKTTYLRSPKNPFKSPELSPSNSFKEITPIKKPPLLEYSKETLLFFKDIEDQKRYKIPVTVLTWDISKDNLNNPFKNILISIDDHRLVKLRKKVVTLGSKNLKVPIDTLAKVVKIFELLGNSKGLETLPTIVREPGDLAAQWVGKGNIMPYMLIRRSTTNIDQTLDTFSKALALATNNHFQLQVPKK